MGGGIAGLSLAAQLAERASDARVTVTEAEPRLAHHTSGRSAQQLILSYGPAAVQELTARTIEILVDEQRGLPEPLLTEASFMLVGTEAEMATSTWPGLERIDTDELRRKVPTLTSEQLTVGGYESAAMRTNALGLVHWQADRARAAGARILTSTTVEMGAPVAKGGYQVTLRTENGREEVHADVVVNAAGAWADETAHKFGVDPLGLTPLRRSAATVSLEPEDQDIPEEHPLTVRADDSWYFRPFGDAGRTILVSPSEAEPSEPEDAQPRQEQIAAVLDAIRADTSLKLGEVHRAWTGLRTEASDGVPVNGFDGQHPQFYWLAGQSGYGFQTSAAMARLATDQVLTRTVGEWITDRTVAALNPQRLRHKT